MPKINVLSREVSELIAAGEVIDRPASVVKELLENAIDAGANIITVEIKNGGRTYIRITDNGCGIASEDVPTAFLRHATSKIAEKDDLNAIGTLGFRGEALASVCAVAKVSVLTKRAEDELGTRYEISGSEETVYEPAGCPDGTTFIIRDIFYNVPARLKFLKKDISEANKVSEIVTKLALSHPEISFKYIRDNKPELVTAGDGKVFSSIYSVFGRDFAGGLLPVDYTHNGVHIGGYICKPLCGKPNRKFQRFFVNNRYVRSDICVNALEEAYTNTIMVGRFPSCVLYLDVPPDIVDVNVHPTKIEVRFSDNALVREAVYFAVKNSLMTKDKTEKMVFEQKRNFTDKELYVDHDIVKSEQLRFSFDDKRSDSTVPESKTPVKAAMPVPPVLRQEPARSKPSVVIENDEPPVDNKAQKNDVHEDLFLKTLRDINSVPYKDRPVFDEKPEPEKKADIQPEPVNEQIPVSDKKDEVITSAAPVDFENDENEYQFISGKSFEKPKVEIVSDEEPEPVKPVIIGEIFKTYIILQAGDDMYMIDKHAAHERVLFEKIRHKADELEPQLFLEPVMVLLSYDEYDAISENTEKIRTLGFEIECDVAPTVAVKGMPLVLGDMNPADIIPELAKNFIDCKADPKLELFDEMFHSMACKAAIKANDDNDILELQSLVNAVYGNNDIRYCPHGRPVMIKLTKKDIEKQFRRIV